MIKLIAMAIFLSLPTISHADKNQNIWLVTHWGSSGGAHGVNEAIVPELEKKGWSINNGRGSVSLDGCAQQLNHVRSTTDPVVYVMATNTMQKTYANPDSECYHPVDIEDEFFSFWFGYTAYISRAAGKNLPSIDEATGVIRVGVEPVDSFGSEREHVLRSLAPNAEVVLVRYFGRNEILAGVAAGEIDYTWHAVEENSSNGLLITDYNTGSGPINGTESISQKFSHIDFSQELWAGLFYKNMDNELKEEFLDDYLSVFESQSVSAAMKNKSWFPPKNPDTISVETIKRRLDMID